ncbi:mCG141826, isoform CRA_a, partial [Mus musculus]
TLAGQPLASWGRAARGLHFPGRQAVAPGSDAPWAQCAGARAAKVYIRKVRRRSRPFVPAAPRAFALFPICLVPPGLTCRWLT